MTLSRTLSLPLTLDVVEERDKAQRDVHFMLVEKQERALNSEQRVLEAKVAKQHNALEAERYNVESLRIQLRDAEKQNRVLTDADTGDMKAALVQETKTKKVLEEKVLKLEQAVIADKQATARAIRSSSIEILLHKSQLQRSQMMHQWGTSPGVGPLGGMGVTRVQHGLPWDPRGPIPPTTPAEKRLATAEYLAKRLAPMLVHASEAKEAKEGKDDQEAKELSRFSIPKVGGSQPQKAPAAGDKCTLCGHVATTRTPKGSSGIPRHQEASFKKRLDEVNALVQSVSPAAQKARMEACGKIAPTLALTLKPKTST